MYLGEIEGYKSVVDLFVVLGYLGFLIFIIEFTKEKMFGEK